METGQLERGPMHSEGMSAYGGHDRLDWTTQYRGQYRGCSALALELTRAATGRRSMPVDPPVSDDRIVPLPAHASTYASDFVGHERAPGFDDPLPWRETLGESHVRCIEHECPACWSSNLASAYMDAEVTPQDAQKSYRSRERQRSMGVEERERLWRRWQRSQRPQKAAGTHKDTDTTTTTTVSVMPAGVRMRYAASHGTGASVRQSSVSSWSGASPKNPTFSNVLAPSNDGGSLGVSSARSISTTSRRSRNSHSVASRYA